MSEDVFEFDFRFREPDVRRAAWRLFKWRWYPHLPWRLPLEGAACIAFVWIMHRFWPRELPDLVLLVAASLVGAAVLGSLIYFPLAFLSYRKALLRLWVDRSLRVRMTMTGISISSDTETHDLAWAAIRDAERTPHDLFLYIGPGKAISLPREGVPPTALSFAEERVGSGSTGRRP